MNGLFDRLKIRELRLKNRVFVSPMCQYSSDEGKPTAWHLVHLGSRAVGGAGLIILEATSVSPEGRISPHDSGIWNPEQSTAFKAITEFMVQQGTVPGIQLSHAGRKASTRPPALGGGPLHSEEHPWEIIAPSSIPFADGYPTPRAMNLHDIEMLIDQFEIAAKNSLEAGFQVLELHMAHGYLLHEFLSPLSNKRTDEYGGSFENRIRLPLQIAGAVRKVWPEQWPVFVRISCTDWVDDGWDIKQSVQFAKLLREQGIDLIDCSSGGILPGIKIPVKPGYQVPFSTQIRKEARILTGAVGLITEPRQAQEIITSGQADAVLLGREMLRNPYWTVQAAKALGFDLEVPAQYRRAF